MTTFLLLGTATEASRPVIAQESAWLDQHLATLEAYQTTLQNFYFTLDDMLFVIDAPDAVIADKVAVALSAHGLLRVQALRAYNADEYRDLIAPPRPPVQQVYDLESLQSQTTNLIEHHTDSQSVHLDNYSSAIIRTGGNRSGNPLADLAVSNGDEVVLKFADDISAIGFTFQQGLYNADFELSLADGTTMTFTGWGFLPGRSFTGIIAQQPISGLMIRTQGSFYLQDFYFYAQRRYESSPGVEPNINK